MNKIVLYFGTLFLFLSLNSKAQNSPKNIIILICDGWGENQIKATNYWNGTDSMPFEKFPVKKFMSTYPATTGYVWENADITKYNTGYQSAKAWTDSTFIFWNYTTSAQAATAMASGFKTAKYAVGVAIDSTELELITERAISIGKSAGVVTSVPFSHATPAAFSVHNIDRNNYSQIARDFILDSKLKVVMGCGHPKFDNNATELPDSLWNFSYVGGQDTWDSLVVGSVNFNTGSTHGNTTVQDITGDANPDNWTLLEDSLDFANLAEGITNYTRVLGIPKVRETLQEYRGGATLGVNPYAVPLNKSVPSLVQMSKAAINVLKSDNDGFFLMIEGGAIDWAGHGNSLNRSIEELDDFNNTVQAVSDWVEANGGWEENLVIVTGDHETGYLVGDNYNNSDVINSFSIINNGAGAMPDYKYLTNGHTNQLIPFFAKGLGSSLFNEYADEEDYLRGRFIDNTNIAQVCFDLWPEATFQAPEPKNVIIMISDGCSYNQINAANYYHGETQQYQSWRNYAMSTYAATTGVVSESSIVSKYNTWYRSKDAWTDWNFLNQNPTSSGQAATAMFAGVKTAKSAIGVDINGQTLKSIGERLFETGKSFGVVTSVPISHATPASMASHNINRGNYAQIANEMIIDSKLSVLMGCGNPNYDNNGNPIGFGNDFNYVGGKGTWNNLLSNAITFDSLTINGNNTVQDVDGDGNPDAWTVIQDSLEFANLYVGKTPLRVIGIPKVYTTLQQARLRTSSIPYSNAFNQNIPSLADMSKVALNVLDNNTKGFLLMIEGGAIDWAGHGNQPERVIEEETEFNKAVNEVINWVETNSNWDETILIITGDHETGYITNVSFNTADIINTFAVSDNGAGSMPSMKFNSTTHTNQLVPIFIKGKGEETFDMYADHYDFVRGRFMNNTEIGQGLFKMWKNAEYSLPIIDSTQTLTSFLNTKKDNVNISIFPNPTTGQINIFGQEGENYLIEVYNIEGKQVLSDNFTSQKQIDLTKKKGIYLIKIISDKNSYCEKIFLQ